MLCCQKVPFKSLVFSLATLLCGCNAASSKEPPVALAGMTACKDPRPQVCTMQYDPVCAQDASGVLTTKSNGCRACTSPEVLGYVGGSCESLEPGKSTSDVPRLK
jgi:hypothetical protein